MRTFGERLAFARRNARMTQRALAEKLDADKSSVHSWERRGVIPNGQTVAEMAALLSVSADFLLSGSSSSEPTPEASEPAA